MVRVRKGVVLRILRRRAGVTEIVAGVDGQERMALNYEQLTGPVREGDQVILNLTAVDLGVGTSGFDFVVWNLRHTSLDLGGPGHVFKLRYTPLQFTCLAAEEQGSEHHEQVGRFAGLRRRPVVVAELHSMVAAVAAGVRAVVGRKARIVYLMTDGASLPAGISLLLPGLEACGLVDCTVTAGHAFGGDYEAVNVYSGLVVGAEVARADVMIVAPGPGVVGTGTRYGHSAVHQGEALNAVGVLGGTGIGVLRISFADPRERHRGLSHHTRVALGEVALVRCVVVVPEGEDERLVQVREEMKQAGIYARHSVVSADGFPALRVLEEAGAAVSSMGRSPADDPLFFLAAGAAGVVAGQVAATQAGAGEGEEGTAVARRRNRGYRALGPNSPGETPGTAGRYGPASRWEPNDAGSG